MRTVWKEEELTAGKDKGQESGDQEEIDAQNERWSYFNGDREVQREQRIESAEQTSTISASICSPGGIPQTV